MLKSKRFWLVVCVLLLVFAIGAVASAETTITFRGTAHKGITVGTSTVKAAEAQLNSQSKSVIVTPGRGKTVNEWIWADKSGGYYMPTGDVISSIRFSYYGSWYTVSVTQGAYWLGVNKTANGWSWTAKSSNPSMTYGRIGKIRVYDYLGTVYYLTIYQAPKMTVDALYQTGTRSIDIDWINSSFGTGTKVYRSTNNYAYYLQRTCGSTVIGFRQSGLTKNVRYYYYLRPFKYMGSKTVIGPRSSIVSKVVW